MQCLAKQASVVQTQGLADEHVQRQPVPAVLHAGLVDAWAVPFCRSRVQPAVEQPYRIHPAFQHHHLCVSVSLPAEAGREPLVCAVSVRLVLQAPALLAAVCHTRLHHVESP